MHDTPVLTNVHKTKMYII